MVAGKRLDCGCPTARFASRAAGAYVVTRSAYTPSCTLGVHAHAEDRIALTLRGKLDSTYGRRAFSLDELHAIYRPAHVEHVDAYSGPALCASVRLPDGERGRREAFAFCDDELPGVAVRLCAELDATDSASDLAIESLSALLAARLSSAHEREQPAQRWVRRVRDLLEDQYADPPTLQAISAAVERDASHVATVFRKTYGKTIGDYVRDVRVWRTRKLVEDAAIPLADVAQRGGFADQSHFARVFKRRFAVTPGEYRRRVATKPPPVD